MSTLNSKEDRTPAISMLQEESDLQSIGTPSDQERPLALPRRKSVFPKPTSTFATIVVFGAAFFVAFLAGAFLAGTFLTAAFLTAAFFAGAFFAGALTAAFLAGALAATFLAGAFLAATFLTAAFLTAFLAAFLAAAIVVFFMSLYSDLVPVVVLDSAEEELPTGSRFPRMNTYFCAIATVR